MIVAAVNALTGYNRISTLCFVSNASARAQLQGATLYRTQLQGATLIEAQLQGATLTGAQLQGATLDRAHLQGVEFQDAILIAVEMRFAEIWRTSFENSRLDKIFEDSLSEDPMSTNDFAAFKDMIVRVVPWETLQETTLKRIEILPVVSRPEASDRKALKALEQGSVDRSAYEKALAEQLKNLVCSGHDDAPLILRVSYAALSRISEWRT